MNAQELQKMLVTVANEMTQHTQELCQLDSLIGDGDHGMTVERGFKAVLAAIENADFEAPAQVLKATGDALVSSMGGAIGPIMGSFFRGGCKKLADVKDMDAAAFELMLTSGLRQIKLIGEAEEGDRTLVDALAPAVRAFAEARESGAELSGCMEKAAAAAEEGALNTKNMVAKKGRAKFIGEKSLGHVDAGATSMSLILRSMSDYLKQ